MTFDQAREALRDPSTSEQMLAEIAYLFPLLHEQIKVHPQVYADLIDWMNQAGSPDAAVSPQPLQPTPMLVDGQFIDPALSLIAAKKPSRRLKWVLIPGIALVVLAGSVGAYAVFGDNKPQETEVAAPPSAEPVPDETPVVEENVDELDVAATPENPVALEAPKLLEPTPMNEVFPDPVFAQCIVDALGDYERETTSLIVQEDLDFIYSMLGFEDLWSSPGADEPGTTENQIYVASSSGGILICDDPKIASIEGAQYLAGVTYFRLASETDLDLGPISGFDALAALILHAPNLSDISSIAGLTELRQLSLNDSQVSDISALKDMTELISLGLKSTPVVDISPLAQLTKMQILLLDGTEISDVTALSGMTDVHFLALFDTNVADISPLKTMESVMDLGLGDTKVADISALSEMEYLWLLRLDNTQVEDISPLKNSKYLASLDLSGTNVNDVSALQGLANLQTISLQSAKVTDFSPLDGLVANGLYINR